jgi:hypothetical protein
MTANEKCPYCGGEIARASLAEVTARIRAAEREKLSAKELAIRKELNEAFLTRLELEKKNAADAERERAQKSTKELRDNLTKLRSEHEQAQKTIGQASEREAALKRQVVEQAQREKQRELTEQRDILEKEHQRKLATAETEHRRVRDNTNKQLEALQRQLKKQTANDLGDGGEINLFEDLRDAFRDDRIRRVPKGEAGADIHQTVVHNGHECGLIVFDSKNRDSWKDEFAKKLHEDQLKANAHYAVLATRPFPAGRKELCSKCEVILVNPARAVQLVQVLREFLVKIHCCGLSQKERKTKTEKLYQLITSDQYARMFAEAGRLTREVLNVDVDEKKAHEKVWERRGLLATKLKKVLAEINSQVTEIVETSHTAVTADREVTF